MKPSNLSADPAHLHVLSMIGLIWSGLTALAMLGGILVVALLGAGSWIAGPVVGAFGTAIGLVVILFLVASSGLSLMLFIASWRTLHHQQTGLPLLRSWAWLSVIFDAIALLFTGGLSPTSWFGLVYAGLVIYFTNPIVSTPSSAGSYFTGAAGKPTIRDDESF